MTNQTQKALKLPQVAITLQKQSKLGMKVGYPAVSELKIGEINKRKWGKKINAAFLPGCL